MFDAREADLELFVPFPFDQTLGHVATQQVENSLPTNDVLSISWNALMASFDWAGRSDQFAKIKVRFSPSSFDSRLPPIFLRSRSSCF